MNNPVNAETTRLIPRPVSQSHAQHPSSGRDPDPLIDDLLNRCGVTLSATFSGNSTIEQFERAHTVDVNCVMCHRSINYVADMLKMRYGIPWFKVNFLGAQSTAKSLRHIAEYFGDAELKQRTERVIAEELAVAESVARDVRTRTNGKKAMLFVGGSRSHHFQYLFSEIGMLTVAAGYEFAHCEDYEGRKVTRNVKVDTANRGIEKLKLVAVSNKHKQRRAPEELQDLAARGLQFSEYEGMMASMSEGSLVVDDINHHEMELLLRKLKPDIFCAGIKEKYVVQKFGIPSLQLHNYDYGGPFACFAGAINFYSTIDRMLKSRAWHLIEPPWRNADHGQRHNPRHQNSR